MECQYCKKIFSSKSSLNTHKKTARYCLKIQGVNVEDIKDNFKCELCGRKFLNNNRYKSHKNVCISNKMYVEKNEQLKDKVKILEDNLYDSKKETEMLKNTICELREQLSKEKERYDILSLTAVKRPTTSTKNIQINNYIQNMEPLKIEDIKDSVSNLTLEHHVKGAEGYAEYALEFPFKDKIVCVDVNRNKIKYKDGEGNVIEDIGFRKMMTKLCESLKDRSFTLCQEHYEKLSEKFTEEEMKEYNCMNTAIAIARYANGRENEFCNKVIKLISKASVVEK